MLSVHQKYVAEFIGKLDARRSMYGSVLVKGFFQKVDSVWVNVSSIIMPLCVSDEPPAEQTLDYGTAMLVKCLISLDDLVRLVKDLPEDDNIIFKLGSFDVQISGNILGDYYQYDSGVEFLDIGWSFERYEYNNRSPKVPHEQLVAENLPLFPGFREVIKDFIGVDVDHYSDVYGIIFCLPNYGARITEVNLSSNTMRVRVEAKTAKLSNVIGKVYCRKGKQVKQEDLSFSETDASSSVEIGFKPEYFQIVLLSKVSGEVLDQRQFHFGWELPRGTVIAIPEYELLELIRNGETDTVELKERVGDASDFAETVVAFANQKGGVIIVGVDDKTNIVGLDNRNHKDTITNIISSHCEPSVDYSIEARTLDQKQLLLVRVEEGRDKPYLLRERGPFIRANGTDRIATRFELDEFYRSRSRGYTGYGV